MLVMGLKPAVGPTWAPLLARVIPINNKTNSAVQLCPATHSVFGIEVRLTGDEVFSTLIVTGPHRHVQRCAEQLEKRKTLLIGWK